MSWLITYSAVIAGIVTMNLARHFLLPLIVKWVG